MVGNNIDAANAFFNIIPDLAGELSASIIMMEAYRHRYQIPVCLRQHGS